MFIIVLKIISLKVSVSKSLNNDAGGNMKSKNNVYDSVENDSLKVLVINPFLLLLWLYDWFFIKWFSHINQSLEKILFYVEKD